MIVFALRY